MIRNHQERERHTFPLENALIKKMDVVNAEMLRKLDKATAENYQLHMQLQTLTQANLMLATKVEILERYVTAIMNALAEQNIASEESIANRCGVAFSSSQSSQETQETQQSHGFEVVHESS